MQTLFILEYQSYNSGSASALPPLGYQVTDMDSEGEVWRGYKQTLRHGHEVVEE
jgi:hypothetical protein